MRGHLLRWVVGAAVAGLAAAGQVLVAEPAQALPGLQTVTATSLVNSNAFRQVAVRCPTSKIAVGGSYQVIGGSGEIVPTSFIPLPGLIGYEARAYEDETGFAGNWALQVYAMCVDPIHALIVSAASALDSTSPKSATAVCPTGTFVIGTGGWVRPGRGQTVLKSVVPAGNPPTSVVAVGYEDDTGTTTSWDVVAYAVCSAVPTSVVGAASVADSSTPKSVAVRCPVGTFVHGAGMRMGGGDGESWTEALVPVNNAPTHVSLRAVEDEDGTAVNWQVVVLAICAP